LSWSRAHRGQLHTAFNLALAALSILPTDLMAHWPNGCEGSRGIALDEKRGFLFAACEEGRLSVLDSNTGKILGKACSGDGVDINIIAYNRKLGHAYLPGEESATMAIMEISSVGAATILSRVRTVKGAHCATGDDRNQVYVCDASGGRLLGFEDVASALVRSSNAP